MNGVIDSYGNEKEIHVILDNLNTHRPKNDRWLKSHPNVHFHFTPTHTSWLIFARTTRLAFGQLVTLKLALPGLTMHKRNPLGFRISFERFLQRS